MVSLSQESRYEIAKADYQQGKCKSLKELAEKHGLNYHALRKRSERELWKERMSQMSHKLEEKILSKADEYLERKYSRVLKYEKMIDLSQSQQSTTNEGIPLLDVDQILDYTLAESRLHDISTSCLKIIAPRSLDLTSGGVDLGTSFVSAIAKLREDKTRLKLTSADADALLEAEIID